MNTVIGVDSSTQSCKVLVVDPDNGRVLSSGSAPHPDGTSVDPAVWVDALRTAWAGAAPADDVAGVSVAAQQHGMVALDSAGQPVHDALLWNDTRSAPQAAAMLTELGADAWVDAVNVVPVASFTLTKLAWLAQHRPELAERVDRVVLPHDYLNHALTGEYFTDRSDASGTAYFSPTTDSYRTDLLEKFFGRVPLLPPVVAPGDHGGRLLPGWSAGTAVVGAGAGDNAGAALGLGLNEGEVVVSIGTSGTVFTSAAAPSRDPSGAVAGFADATGNHLPLLAMINSARVMTATAAMLNVSLAELDRLATQAEYDAGGLSFLPYLDGERTPNLPDARGTLAGLTRANMTPGNIARAAVLGVLNSLADALEVLKGHGVPVEKVLLIGGGSKSVSLCQAAASVFDVPVEVPAAREYVALGAARQAAWAATGSMPQWERVIDQSFEPSGEWGTDVRGRYVGARKAAYGV
ncbi:xylulokinase [Arthrobacter sp. H5]|uniref:xylulokinase n=1 Tax=Arthrobacter sp. H5 TaxID=1267973 RepID=UPI000486780C|nr:xylulokinase [Arthrobacter sp. H5]